MRNETYLHKHVLNVLELLVSRDVDPEGYLIFVFPCVEDLLVLLVPEWMHPFFLERHLQREHVNFISWLYTYIIKKNNTRLQMRDELGDVHAGEARPVRIALAPRHWSPSLVALHAHNHYAVVLRAVSLTRYEIVCGHCTRSVIRRGVLAVIVDLQHDVVRILDVVFVLVCFRVFAHLLPVAHLGMEVDRGVNAHLNQFLARVGDEEICHMREDQGNAACESK